MDASSGEFERALAHLTVAVTSGIHPSLEGIRALTAASGDPQSEFRSIQVAGTNGKTSTARYIEAILRETGFVTGLYTSPHVNRYTERIAVNGVEVTEDAFAQSVNATVSAAEALRPGTLGTDGGFTEYELLTAAALSRFAEEHVDVAVLEVGMGGRWDSTSVVDPAVAVITGIGLDHMHILGETVEAIAAEKGAIIKPGSVPVFGPGTTGVEGVLMRAAEVTDKAVIAVRDSATPSPVDEETTVRFSWPSMVADESREFGVRGLGAYHVSLHVPAYQAGNIATAIAACESLLGEPLDERALQAAVSAVHPIARFETVSLSPRIVVDGSHNPQAAAVLARAIADEFGAVRPVVVLGVLSDKDAGGIVAELAPIASEFIVCAPASPRALDAEALAETVERVTGTRPLVCVTVSEALSAAILRTAGPIVVAGSLVTAGEARQAVAERSGNV